MYLNIYEGARADIAPLTYTFYNTLVSILYVRPCILNPSLFVQSASLRSHWQQKTYSFYYELCLQAGTDHS